MQEVALVADQEEADGRRVLRQYETVQFRAVDAAGTGCVHVKDGKYESLIV